MNENQTPNLGAMLGQVLNDPAAMQSIMQLAAGMRASQAESGTQSDRAEGGNTSEENRRSEQNRASAAEQAPISRNRGVSENDRAQLLRALRPFLGEDRQKKADAIISIMSLLSAAEKMGLGQNLSQLFESAEGR